MVHMIQKKCPKCGKYYVEYESDFYIDEADKRKALQREKKLLCSSCEGGK